MVDETGWKEVMRTMQRTLDRIEAIKQRCAERRETSGECGISVSVPMAAFETPVD